MSKLDEDVRAADALGISYGYYKALTARPDHTVAHQQRKKRPRKFSDEDAFRLWQEGKTDARIAEALHVSRISIVLWRDQLELPSTWKTSIDTKKYRLITMRDGTAYVLYSDHH